MGLIPSSQTQVPTRFNGMKLTQALLGQPIPILFGQHRLPGKLLWYGDFTSTKAKQGGKSGGSGGGSKKGGGQYVYTASIIAALCQGPCAGLRSVWDGSGKYTVTGTTESTTASSTPYPPSLASAENINGDLGVYREDTYTTYTSDYGSPSGNTQLALTSAAYPTNIAGAWFFSSCGVPVSGNQVFTYTANQASSVGNAFAGMYFLVRNFPNPANNGIFLCAASTLTTLTLVNQNGVAQSGITGTSTASAIGASITYTGTITGGAGNTYAGGTFTVTGFQYDNGVGMVCASSTAATLVLLIPSTALGRMYISESGSGVANTNAVSGTTNTPLTYTAGNPAVGEYTIDDNGSYVFNSDDFGKAMSVSYSFAVYYLENTQLSTVPVVGPYQVTVENQPSFKVDLGVTYYPSGTPLTMVGGSPSVAGTYNPNNGNYLFAAADAGAGIDISYQWKNVNTDQNAPSQLNLTFINGALGQSPWSYMSTKHPGQALGYTQIAYIASSGLYLGYTPEMPNYTYEIAGLYQFGGGVVDACPSDCIEALLTDFGFGVGFPAQYLDGSLQGLTRAFWVANNFFISDCVEGNTNVANVVGNWLEAGQVGVFWSEGLLKFIPYGTSSASANGETYFPPTTPVVSLTDSDYITSARGDDPIKVSRTSWQDAYNRVGVKWTVRTNDYNTDVTPEQDDGAIARFGLRPEAAKGYEFICTQDAATFAANLRLQRNVYIRNSYTFNLKHTFAYLEPMDIIEVNDSVLGLVNYAVRILKIADDPMKGLALTCEDFPWASGNPTLYSKQPVQPSMDTSGGTQDPGDTIMYAVELPATASGFGGSGGNPHPNFIPAQTGNVVYLFTCGANSNWGGCALYKALGTGSCIISHVAIASDVLTVSGSITGLEPGDVVTFFDIGTAAFLDSQSVEILTVTTGPSGNFTAAFTHPDYSSTPDTGSAWAMTTFSLWQGITANSRVGTIIGNPSTGLSIPPATGTDSTDTLTVDMLSPNVELSSISTAAFASPHPATLAALLHFGATSALELVSYKTATLETGSTTAGPRYAISTIQRGLLSTTPAQFYSGDIFARIDDACASYTYPPTMVGQVLFIKAISANTLGKNQQSLSDVVPILIPLNGTVGAYDMNTGLPTTLPPPTASSLVSNGNFSIGSYDWKTTGSVGTYQTAVSGAPVGATDYKSSASAVSTIQQSVNIAVDITKTYLLTCWFKIPAAGAPCYGGFLEFNSAGTQLTHNASGDAIAYALFKNITSTVGNTWQEYSIEISGSAVHPTDTQFNPSTTHISPYFQFNNGAGTKQMCEVTGISLTAVTSSGAITVDGT